MLLRVVQLIVQIQFIHRSSPGTPRDEFIIIFKPLFVIIEVVKDIFWLLGLPLVIRDFLVLLRQSVLELSDYLFRSPVILKHGVLWGHYSVLGEVVAQLGGRLPDEFDFERILLSSLPLHSL